MPALILMPKKTRNEEMEALTALKKITITWNYQHRKLRGLQSPEWSVCTVLGIHIPSSLFLAVQETVEGLFACEIEEIQRQTQPASGAWLHH